ncbi:MAG: flagellin [Myxococcota bacterium]
MIRVRYNQTAVRAYNSLNTTMSEISKSSRQLSSGERINQAADDPARLSMATTFETLSTSLQRALKNTNDGLSIVQTAENATREVVNIMTRVRELAVQSGSETMADSERGYVNEEFLQLREEIERIAQETNFDGIPLTNGETASLLAQVDVRNTAESRVEIVLGDLRVNTLGVDAIDLSSVDGARSAIDITDGVINQLSQYRSDFGAAQNQLDEALSSTVTRLEALSKAENQIMDLDYAKATTNAARLQIIQQAGVAAVSQARNISQGALELLS